MKSAFYLVLLSCFLFSACKKDKSVSFSGKLLLTKKFPLPLANRKIQIYQTGSTGGIGIPASTSSSFAMANTDANGFFNIDFTPGEGRFLIFAGTNAAPLTLSNDFNDTAFPEFARKNFPGPDYDKNAPTFIGKTIDNAIIKVTLNADLIPTDTIGLQAYTINGRIDKEYSGRAAPAGTVIVLDTVRNMLFTRFDCLDKTFSNNVTIGRKMTTPTGYVGIFSRGFVSPGKLSAEDETNREIMYYFSK